MREVIIKEWYDDLDILHQKEVGEIVRCRDCIYYLGHTEYCECDHFAEDNGYCYSGKRRKVNDMGSK